MIDEVWNKGKGAVLDVLESIKSLKKVANPYHEFIPDELYFKYLAMGNGINVTGAALEEMAGVRDAGGVVTDQEVIDLAHEFKDRYDLNLARAKKELGKDGSED